MFQFSDKLLDDLIDNKENILLKIGEKYKIYIVYKTEISIYIEKYNRLSGKYEPILNSLMTFSIPNSVNKEEIKETIMNLLANFILPKIKDNEVTRSLIYEYVLFLLNTGVFNAKKLLIYCFSNVAIISCEHHTEREIFFVHFDKNNVSYLKEFRYINETDYDIYYPYPFILENRLFHKSLYYKDLKLELAYLI